MQCGNCGANNEGTHKFCSDCGSPLVALCASCGHANSPTHRFCSECGAALGAAASDAPSSKVSDPLPPVGGERRLVTSLFADLVGFTPFSEGRDPEEVRAVLTRYFDRSRDIIERFGGVVDKYIGDAITAFWGSSVAEDDDAERAVRAALELVDTVAGLGVEIGVPELALRAGVLTGETSVGPGGNEKGLVLGDVVNTASRLQSIAAPGTVAVGESTVRLTESAIDYTPLGAQELKGKSAPVEAWRALRVSAERRGEGRAEGLEPPYVGREDELRLLKDALHATGREGRARLVSIIGEGGIGKSRIAWELLKYIDGLVETIFWHEGRSPSYGEGVTFWALGEMVRRRAGIAETDDDAKSRLKLRTAVAEWMPDPEEQRWVEPRLAGLLGLSEMPGSDRTELYAALRTFFQRVSEQGTAVLVFEDLHWADAGLLGFIDELVDRSHRHPILVVTLARPELIDREPGWGAARRNTVSVHLGPLADIDMQGLVAGTVPGVPDDLAARIVERAAGVPLYAVEMMRMLLAQGSLVRDGDSFRLHGDPGALAVPETLQAVIGARIDRLSPEERELVQDAAVLGQSFAVDGLVALHGGSPEDLEPGLKALTRREVLRFESDPRSPERGQYAFVQSLIREVAYGRLSMAERRSRHVAVAEYFQRAVGVELAALVASHFMSAYRATPEGAEAEELAVRATTALRAAAQRAADLHSHKQVLAICEEALSITPEGPARAELLLLAARAANGLLLEEAAIGYARQALAWQESHGNEPGRVKAATLLGWVLTDSARPIEAVEVLRTVFADHSEPTSSDEIRLAGALARALMLGESEIEAARVAELGLIPAEAMADMPVLVDLLNTRGTAFGNHNRSQEGIALIKRALELAEQHDLPLAALRAHNNLGVMLSYDDKQAESRNAEAGLAKAMALGDPGYLLRFVFWRVDKLVEEGRYEPGLELLDAHDGESSPLYAAILGFQRARIESLRGDVPGAAARARAALEYVSELEEPQMVYLGRALAAYVSFWEREFARSFQEGIDTTYVFGYPMHLQAATLSAIWMDDAAALERVAAAFDEVTVRGRLVTNLRDLVEAGAASLGGDEERAAGLFGRVIASSLQIDLPEPQTLIRLAAARSLGYDHPLGREAADAAAAWIEEVGAVNMRSLLPQGFGADAVANAAGG